ncbi:MAG TPA: sialate O-acetylesterase [Hanamia sp.]|nr:sialate O-acetylesterase [Hanamia sp.]
MKKNFFLPATIFFSFFYFSANAYLRIPDIFSSNMVLQQQTTIHFYGWSDPGQKISVITGWNGDTLKTSTLSDAVWTVDLKTPKAGGPYQITVIGDSTINIQNVLIGENWICTGQSNMEFSADWHVNNYKEEIKNANHPEIRFFHIQRISAPYPQQEVRGKWEVCTPETMHSFSAAGYFFGRALNDNLHLPVGLIESCWGGSPVESWTPIEVFNNSEKLAISAAILSPVPWCPIRPAVLFNAMIAPITRFPIAGAIWYQGEANVINASTYEETFSAMIHSWRELWKKDFPFYFVQIAPYNYGKGYGGAEIREAQLQTYRNVPKTGMVVVTDITADTNNIHPTDKQDVGKRLADWALAKTYGKESITYSGPLYRSMEVDGNKAIIHFDFATDGLMKKGNELTGFLIAGEDHQFVPATATIEGSTVIVYSSKVTRPTAVRMGFTNTAISNLFNKAGLPASPFRTDDWELK